MGEVLLCAEGDCSIVGVLNGLYDIRQQAQQGKHHRWASCDKKIFFFWGGVEEKNLYFLDSGLREGAVV